MRRRPRGRSSTASRRRAPPGRWARRDHTQRFAPVPRQHHVVALEAQSATDGIAQRAVVIDEQHAAHGRRASIERERRAWQVLRTGLGQSCDRGSAVDRDPAARELARCRDLFIIRADDRGRSLSRGGSLGKPSRPSPTGGDAAKRAKEESMRRTAVKPRVPCTCVAVLATLISTLIATASAARS